MMLLPSAGSRPRGGPNMVKGGPPLNPSGRPKQLWRPPHERAEFLTLKYKTDEIIKFAKIIAAGKRSPLSGQDAIVCVHLANIFQMRDGPERERLYDRYFGKVPDRTINLNLNLDMTPEQLSQRALVLLNKIAPREPETIEAQYEDVGALDEATIEDAREAGMSVEDYTDLIAE